MFFKKFQTKKQMGIFKAKYFETGIKKESRVKKTKKMVVDVFFRS